MPKLPESFRKYQFLQSPTERKPSADEAGQSFGNNPYSFWGPEHRHLKVYSSSGKVKH